MTHSAQKKQDGGGRCIAVVVPAVRFDGVKH